MHNAGLNRPYQNNSKIISITVCLPPFGTCFQDYNFCVYPKIKCNTINTSKMMLRGKGGRGGTWSKTFFLGLNICRIALVI